MGETGEAYDYRSFLLFILKIINVQFAVIRVKIIIAELLLNAFRVVIRVKIFIAELLHFTIQVPQIESLLQIKGRCYIKNMWLMFYCF